MKAQILVIEDNAANLELMLYLLNAFGYKALSAFDGQSGVSLAKLEKPDLIICDVQLPDISGYEVIQRLKASPELQATRVVAVTAYAMVGDRDKLLSSGFDGYLSKPINPETFINELEQFLHPDLRTDSMPNQHVTTQLRQEPITSKEVTILVVDDSPVNLELIRSTLQPAGYKLLFARNAAEAIAVLQVTLPELILSDLHMPYASGYELLKTVKKINRLKQIPFLIITSSSSGDPDSDLCLQLGARKFIVRPIEPELLLTEVADCLAGNELV